MAMADPNTVRRLPSRSGRRCDVLRRAIIPSEGYTRAVLPGALSLAFRFSTARSRAQPCCPSSALRRYSTTCVTHRAQLAGPAEQLEEVRAGLQGRSIERTIDGGPHAFLDLDTVYVDRGMD